MNRRLRLALDRMILRPPGFDFNSDTDIWADYWEERGATDNAVRCRILRRRAEEIALEEARESTGGAEDS
ncbi:MAG: hypothetical protein QGG36_14400 [Pirellulaceae bacterium]|nr:hypothetical protein [Pirellulaceae bacterium]MDP7016992.1 hypothetical protein [Pirellulaceae bacterium]